MKRLTIQPKDLDKAIKGVLGATGRIKLYPPGGYFCHCVVAVAAARDWKNQTSVDGMGRVTVVREGKSTTYASSDPLLKGIVDLFDSGVLAGTSSCRQEKFDTIRKMLPVTFVMEKA